MKGKTESQRIKYVQYLGLLIVFFCTIQFSNGQTAVEKIDLMGKIYTVTKDFPTEILGKYLYEGKGEPIIQLDENGEGLFQPHMVKPIKIKFWIDCDENGTIRKQIGSEGRYQYTLLIQYLDGNDGNYPVGKYNLMGVMILKDLGRAVIYGERYKKL
ncbi:hypothetical protein SAMN03080617_04345 [Algoriphagus alkaliphilus]|uniref:Uncharacterized protein n=1 Tax=Algoriphagus alkaliphilus TaxID=279824 RepID=A0A1G5ZQX5_9BACT|nr:hypothetical protein [Algoriphagus alkaliphilus]SDA97229.1 hypothetical protein SAMN03080617_04345 [Algoriphagus alkaliphilus]